MSASPTPTSCVSSPSGSANSGDHREIRELEKEMSEAALGAAINHVMQAADDDPDDRGSAS